MGRVLALIYGIMAYAGFLGAFLYTIGFVGNFIVPKSIDSGIEGPVVISVAINLLVLSGFALQHSVMARPAFKRVWTRVVPKSVERSTYVLMANLALVLIFVYWQPLPNIVWDVSSTNVGTVLQAVFWAGWLIVLTSTFMIDHFDLVGLRQVYLNLKQQKITHKDFCKRAFYKLVRHPIMTGFLIAFWATPTMTIGHFLFAVVMTTYIYIAVKHFEEKDLIAEIGEPYRQYQSEVGPFFPGIGKSRRGS